MGCTCRACFRGDGLEATLGGDARRRRFLVLSVGGEGEEVEVEKGESEEGKFEQERLEVPRANEFDLDEKALEVSRTLPNVPPSCHVSRITRHMSHVTSS